MITFPTLVVCSILGTAMGILLNHISFMRIVDSSHRPSYYHRRSVDSLTEFDGFQLVALLFWTTIGSAVGFSLGYLGCYLANFYGIYFLLVPSISGSMILSYAQIGKIKQAFVSVIGLVKSIKPYKKQLSLAELEAISTELKKYDSDKLDSI